MNKITSTIALVILLLGCNASKTVIINQQYKDSDFSQREVTLLPIPIDAIDIKDTMLIKNNFEDDKRPAMLVVHDSLYSGILSEASSSPLHGRMSGNDLHSFLFKTQDDTSKFIAIKLHVTVSNKDSEYTFYVPRKEQFPNQTIEVGLAVNKFTVTKNSAKSPVYIPGGTFPGGGTMPDRWEESGNSYTYLSATVKFIMWDYQAGQPVAYGIVDMTESGLFPGAAMTVLFRETSRKMFQNSPFRGMMFGR